LKILGYIEGKVKTGVNKNQAILGYFEVTFQSMIPVREAILQIVFHYSQFGSF
jgi:hypothetical protein